MKLYIYSLAASREGFDTPPQQVSPLDFLETLEGHDHTKDDNGQPKTYDHVVGLILQTTPRGAYAAAANTCALLYPLSRGYTEHSISLMEVPFPIVDVLMRAYAKKN